MLIEQSRSLVPDFAVARALGATQGPASIVHTKKAKKQFLKR
jgi:hypothetical protein